MYEDLVKGKMSENCQSFASLTRVIDLPVQNPPSNLGIKT